MQITEKMIEKFQEDFKSNPVNEAMACAVSRVGLQEASFNPEVKKVHNHFFSSETKRGEITNQKSSGRCWMFAALNVARVDTMKKLNLETTEMSQAYTLFWDKIEKSNFFLESILETLDEPLEGRLLAHLLTAPVQDGGQWDMFAGLLEKYGAVPKDVMPETFHSSNTRALEGLITRRLRKYTQLLREAHQKGESMEGLRKMKEGYLSDIYSILVKALGQPPKTFDFEYKDKDKKFHKVENLTPQKFFKEFVGWDLKEKVSLINAPTKDKPFGKAYTVKFLGTVKELDPIHYINVPIEVLKKATVDSIKDGIPVWFGCDVGQMSNNKEGIMDLDIFNYDVTVGAIPEFNKAERLDYGESLLTHAMVFTGVDEGSKGIIKWQVENSWGDELGKKGIFSMSDAWFDEYVYQIMVDRKYIPAEYLKALDEPLVKLEPWDPMGALAMMK